MSAPTLLPRWFAVRATRLSSLVVEAMLETHGHEGLAHRLGEAAFAASLQDLLGIPQTVPVDELLTLLEMDLQKEHVRLGLRLDAQKQTLTLGDGRAFPVFAIDDVRVIRLHAPRRPVVEPARHLGAAMMVARGARSPILDALEPLSPPTASRTRASLALLGALIAGPAPQADLLRLTLGSIDGEPLGVSLVLYDELIAVLERLLHGPGRKRSCR
ncbi:MAG: hypothetical protein ACO3JL_13215, partial [Myxococcota bacterium]